jgi:hypothetical protein
MKGEHDQAINAALTASKPPAEGDLWADPRPLPTP